MTSSSFSSPLSFPGEEYLRRPLPPDYAAEWNELTIRLAVLAALLVVVVVALAVAVANAASGFRGRRLHRTREVSKGGGGDLTAAAFAADRKDPTSSSTSTSGSRTGIAADGGSSGRTTSSTSRLGRLLRPFPVAEVLLAAALYLLAAASLTVLRSPNNTYTPKRVFVAPLFRPEECRRIIDMAEGTARRKYDEALALSAAVANEKKKVEEAAHLVAAAGGTNTQQSAYANDDDSSREAAAAETEAEAEAGGGGLLSEPGGWNKARHGSYPTTDLNFVTDPFSDDDRKYLGKILDDRLGPIVERLYGINPRAIRANDIFVVRYDTPGHGRPSLPVHTDSSHVSFNVLLNSPDSGDFEGGGTRYHDPLLDRRYGLRPSQGEVLLNDALVPHEGLEVTNGTRYILVGFLSVRTRRHNTGERTGLSPYASYLSLTWLNGRIREGAEAATAMRGAEGEKAAMSSDISGLLKAAVFARFANSEWILSVLSHLRWMLSLIVDVRCPLRITHLVRDSERDDFLTSLDDAAANARAGAATRKQDLDGAGDRASARAPLPRASWFEGQGMAVALDGTPVRLGGLIERDRGGGGI